MSFLQEAMNDFYRDQTFYTAAKKYQPELKKQILSFLMKKGIAGFSSAYDWDPKFTIKDIIAKEPKDRRTAFRGVLAKTEIGKEFFTVSSTYNAKIDFPVFTFNNHLIDMEIKSNDSFFEDGHDLDIKVTPISDEGPSYQAAKTFSYKLNLLRPIDIVLEDLWKDVIDSITNIADAPEKKYKPDNRKYIESDIKKIVELYLNTYYNVLKSGKKSEITDSAKQPAEFHVTMDTKDYSNSSTGRGNPGFELRFKIRQLTKTQASTGSSSYSRRTVVDPRITSLFPNYEEWFKIYNTARSEITGKQSYGFTYDSMNFANTFGEKMYSEEHMKILERLKIVVTKFMKMGYVPVSGRKASNDREESKIQFEYSEKAKENVNRDPSIIDRFFSSNRYKDHVEKTFFYQGSKLENVPRNILYRVFNQLGNK